MSESSRIHREEILSRAAAGEAEVSEIEASISQTRAELDEDLRQMEQLLSPSHVAEQALEYFRDGPSQVIDALGRTIRGYPLPTAMFAIGLIWLVSASVRNMSASPSFAEERNRGRYRRSQTEFEGEAMSDKSYSSGEDYSSGSGSSGGSGSGGYASKAKETVSQFGDKLQSTVGNLGTTARDTYSKVAEQTSRIGSTVREQAGRLQGNARDLYAEQPLLLGVIAFIAGAAIAAALPRTEREDNLLGEMSDGAMERAKEKLSEVKDEAVNLAKTAIAGEEGQAAGGSASTAARYS